jgi:site-specific recombinase XerD
VEDTERNAAADGMQPEHVVAAQIAKLEDNSQSTELMLADQLPRDRHPVLVYLASLSRGSRRTMRASLEAIAGFVSDGEADALSLAWHKLRYQHTALIRTTIVETYSPATANKMLSALRGVLKECFRLGYLSADDYARARDLPVVRGSAPPKGRALSQKELKALFEICAKDSDPARGARDIALLAVLYGCGLRRSEVVALDASDYDQEGSQLIVRTGKGNKGRISYAGAGANKAIERWLSFRGEAQGPLFCPIIKGGRIATRRMTDQAVLYILQRRAKEVGAKTFSPHDIRRTFIGDLLDAGADIATVQRLAGHANVQTTARYDRRGEVAKKKAASLLHVPYAQRD